MKLVVGFSRATYQYNPDGHSLVPGTDITMQAYSSNGGNSWSLEYPSALNATSFLTKHSGALNFTTPCFAFKIRTDAYWYSDDKAANWDGPYQLPDWGNPHRSRTDYTVLSSNSMKLFMVANADPSETFFTDRPHCAETTNGCLNFNPVNWMCPSPHTNWGPNNYYTMPSTVKINSTTYISAIRKRDKLDVDGKVITIYYYSTGEIPQQHIAATIWSP